MEIVRSDRNRGTRPVPWNNRTLVWSVHRIRTYILTRAGPVLSWSVLSAARPFFRDASQKNINAWFNTSSDQPYFSEIEGSIDLLATQPILSQLVPCTRKYTVLLQGSNCERFGWVATESIDPSFWTRRGCFETTKKTPFS